MGRVFSVDFEGPDYYMCKICRTHIALPLNPDNAPQPGRLNALFIAVINVEVNNRQRPLFGINWDIMHMVSDVYCIKCGNHLGLKYIQTASDERMRRNDFVQL
ncbi:protein yippee-like At3g55890 [Primulina huaijiensis]|uniref:protein yippee-like At3g55890 n=1 Tax=Primulina huaijiensis TaxID=1492673 RepID=UPI003CC7144E